MYKPNYFIQGKRLLAVLLMTAMSFSAFSQVYDLNLKATVLKNNGSFKKGETFTISKLEIKKSQNAVGGIVDNYFLENEFGKKSEISGRMDECFTFVCSTPQDVWDTKIVNNVLMTLKKKGSQSEMRTEMENDALDYIQKVKNMGLELDDPYLESYLYSLVAKIAPKTLIDGRPCSINLMVQQNPVINACTYPNGTIVLNTGLLASLHTEDELVAILAHEIAHFVLDHGVNNVNKAVARQKRAEFWSAVATGITAAAEVSAASKNKHYVPGMATLGMAVLSSEVAAQVVERLGMNYNHEQEREADLTAIDILNVLGYDMNAMSTALSRIEQYYDMERSNLKYLSSYTHPDLLTRIEEVGTPEKAVNKDFEQMVSFAVTNMATMKFQDRRFHQCIPYVKQNIANGVSTAEDYILLANCLMNTQNTDASNQEALGYIQKAKHLDSGNINACKAEVLAKLRLKKNTEAESLLKEYISKLDAMKGSLKEIQNESMWAETQRYITGEQYWANQMLIKLGGMRG